MTFGIVKTIMALPVFDQSIISLQPEELRAFNEQPLLPAQGVMGKPKSLALEIAPNIIILDPTTPWISLVRRRLSP